MARSLLIENGLFETRAALLQDGQLLEVQIERSAEVSRVGDFYLGRVAKVLDDLDAAFVEIDNNETGFLQAHDIDRKNDGIASLVHEGQKLLVQVIKDPLENKDLQLGCHFQIESPNLIYRPKGQGLILSKQISSKQDRARLTAALEPKLTAGGLIVRTSARLASAAALDTEIFQLFKAWRDIENSQGQNQTPRRLSPQQTPLDRTLNDLLQPDMEVIVTTPLALQKAKSFIEKNARDESPKITLWTKASSLFEEFGIEAQIETALDKKIHLEEGVSITLEPTEAMVVIDVNSGRHIQQQGGKSIALHSNLIAASEIARQIRLRNYSGIIIVDFIKMSGSGEIKQLQRHMEKLLQEDPVHSRMIGLTELGLMQLTRRRSKRALHSLMMAPCPICQGSGCQRNPTSALSALLRALESHTHHTAGSVIKIAVGSMMAEQLSSYQQQIESQLGRRLSILKDANLPSQAFSIE